MLVDTSTRPVLVAAIGVALFSALDAMMKVIASAYPLGQSTGMRYLAGACVALLYYAWLDGRMPTRDEVIRSIPRSLANLFGGATFFLAVSRLALTDAIAITFLSPAFLSFWGWLLLRESLKIGTFIAIGLGLTGVFVIANGQSFGPRRDFDPIGVAAAVACAASYALSMVLTRRQSGRDTLPTLVLLPSLIGAVISVPAMIVVWQPVAFWHYWIIACVGVLGTAGYICLSWAYAHSRVGRLGLMEYSGFLWAAAFGFVFFAEIPSAWTIAGALLIMAACLTAFRREAPVSRKAVEMSDQG